MSKREQLVAVEELLSVAKTCLYRIASSYHGALGNQTIKEVVALGFRAKYGVDWHKAKEGGAE